MRSREFLKACRTESVDTVSKLLTTIPEPDIHRTKGDETALHVAITCNPDPAGVTKLLLQHGHDPNARGYRRENRTPLHDAARRGCAETVSALLASGARVGSVKKGDWTPLLVACLHGHVDVVRVLLDGGASVHATNAIGETCIHLAARVSVECLVVCVENGGIVSARTRNGKTGLHYAARAGKTECARVILENGGEVRQVDSSGMTALHDGCVGGFVEVVAELLQWDSDAVWLQDCGGLTGLHHAAICGNVEVVKFLVTVGGPLDCVDNRGYTALKLALLNGQSEIAKLL